MIIIWQGIGTAKQITLVMKFYLLIKQEKHEIRVSKIEGYTNMYMSN
jgi:hypothetical protein